VTRILFAVALVGACAAATAQAEPAKRPALAIIRSAPSFVVRGTSFKSREQVRLTLTASTRRSKLVRASAAGAFTADFGAVFIDPCDAFSVRAVGRSGSVALLKIPQRACSSG
jgi:hypothetical protein